MLIVICQHWSRGAPQILQSLDYVNLLFVEFAPKRAWVQMYQLKRMNEYGCSGEGRKVARQVIKVA